MPGGGSVFTGPGGPIDKFPAAHPYRELTDPITAIEVWISASGAAAVTSVFGRTGTVTAQTGDYTAAQVGAMATGTGLLLTGGTMSGAIAMGTSKITGLGNGTAATDAAAFGQLPVPNLGYAVSSALGSGTTTSGTFANLSVTSATVTLTTGTKALVIISAQLSNSTLADYATLGVAVSGASTISASGSFALYNQSPTANNQIAASMIIPFGLGGGGPGVLTAGSNVFTAQLAVGGGGTASASTVLLTVIPLN